MRRHISVGQESFTENIINRSRFISQCFPVKSEEEALAFLAEVRSKYADATHVCYAYRVGELAETTRFSDAGEPSGTAGMPILDVLRNNDVTDALITVTRYFGGILLGTGGLVRAYSSGAVEALKLAGKVERLPAALINLNIEYTHYGQLEGYIRQNARVDKVDYTDIIEMTVSVKADEADAFIAEIIDRSNGRVQPAVRGESVIELKIQ